MKLKDLQTPRFRNGGDAAAVTLVLCLLLCFIPLRVCAQSRVQKRITSVWTATGAEGSRVTVASDTQLNDYEAYTRGDRFYVRIPLADLPSSTGSLLGRGFDNFQIQRVGDGILLSFHLQPGTTARVDQKLNRIEVVFSIPMRFQGSTASATRDEVASRTRARTIRDTVGPAPPTSSRENITRPGLSTRHAERGARTSGSVRSTAPSKTYRGTTKGSASESNKQKSTKERSAPAASTPGRSTASSTNTNSTAGAKQPRPGASPSPIVSSENKGSAVKGAVPSPSPLASSGPTYSPASIASSSPVVAAASPSGTPLALSATQQASPSASPIPASTSASTSDWSSSLHNARTWVRYNPKPLAIFGLLFVALLLILFVRGGRKRRRGEPRSERWAATTAAAQPVSADPASAVVGQRRDEVSPASSASAAAASNHAGEDPDREVFEL